jgi:hypothetical protein
MDRRTYLCEGVFWPHRTTPDLCVVEEEQLIVSELYPRQSRLLSMFGYPLLVSLHGGRKSLFFYYTFNMYMYRVVEKGKLNKEYIYMNKQYQF